MLKYMYRRAVKEEKAMGLLKKTDGWMCSNRCVFLSDFSSFPSCVKPLVFYSSIFKLTQVTMLEDDTENHAEMCAISDSHAIWIQSDAKCNIPNYAMSEIPSDTKHNIPNHTKHNIPSHTMIESHSHENSKIESHEKSESHSHENDDSHSLEKLESHSHENGEIERHEKSENHSNENGKTDSYEKHKSDSYDEKPENESHENGKMKSYENDKVESNRRSDKDEDNVQFKRQEKSVKKCKSHDRSVEKLRKNSSCKIHSTSPQKHKNQSTEDVCQMKRHGGYCSCEKTGKHRVHKKSMRKVLFVVPVKQRCPHSLKRKVIEICTCKKSHKCKREKRKIQTSGYTVPSHTRVTKKSKKRMMYNYRKNGKSVEVRIKKEDRHTHEQLRKTIFGHTSRTINKIINADQDKRTKKVKNIMKGKIRSKAGKKRKTCEFRKQKFHELKGVDNGNLSVCWLCDKIDKCGTRKMQCDKCCVWFHNSCSGFLDMEKHLICKTFTWVCRKCGHGNYSDSLFHNFGIPTDENVFDLACSGMDQCYTDGFMDQVDVKKDTIIQSSSIVGHRSVHGSQVEDGTSIMMHAVSWHGVYSDIEYVQ